MENKNNAINYIFGKAKIQILKCTIPGSSPAGNITFRFDLDTDYEKCTGFAIANKNTTFVGFNNDLSIENQNGTFLNPTNFDFLNRTISGINQEDRYWNCYIPARGRRVSVHLDHSGVSAVDKVFYILFRLENNVPVPQFEYNLQQKLLNFTPTEAQMPYTQLDYIYFDNSYNECIGFQTINIAGDDSTGTFLRTSQYATTFNDGDKILLEDCNNLFPEIDQTVSINKSAFPLNFNSMNKTIRIKTYMEAYVTPAPATYNLNNIIVFILKRPYRA